MGIQYFIFVGLGGACGSVTRALLSVFVPTATIWNTVLVNLTGALLIGALLKYSSGLSEPMFFRAFWMVGVCGGFTTFSTFGLELVELLQSGNLWRSALYVSLNFLGTLLFILVGFRIGDHFSQTS
jgi:CrcB protein